MKLGEDVMYRTEVNAIPKNPPDKQNRLGVKLSRPVLYSFVVSRIAYGSTIAFLFQNTVHWKASRKQ